MQKQQRILIERGMRQESRSVGGCENNMLNSGTEFSKYDESILAIAFICLPLAINHSV
jgi:hypothetical protein